MEEINQWCFACGPANPIGLKLEFQEMQDTYCAKFVAGPEHQGYDGIVHGGIVSTLLDEVMARYIFVKGVNAVTARLEVRFRQPTPIAQELTITAKIAGKTRNIYDMTADVRLPDGTVTAQGKAKVAVVTGVIS
ncbi:MAG TPA: PaaI family thioesterase [Patescibacteria group bacterium]|nr:PaaI family thioesterase [Patescibacteria group bacterium]